MAIVLCLNLMKLFAFIEIVIMAFFCIDELFIETNEEPVSVGDALGTTPSFIPRWSLQPKSSRASLASDDSGLEFCRKSSGSTHSGPPMIGGTSGTSGGTDTLGEPAKSYVYVCDDLERHPDGTVVLRIPTPHVVAARAYRV
ncbi:unnamed protein product [Hermetia illucens]|uniref:Uncharacterized protein n=1 Tax=Hermetia illucens TaxID=343691 RepID=A0A7R8UW55_HERIL|nr:unnamed protein product [Hermetia illucens]